MLQNNVNRNLDYLHRKRFEYKKEPTTDVPTKKYYWGLITRMELMETIICFVVLLR